MSLLWSSPVRYSSRYYMWLLLWCTNVGGCGWESQNWPNQTKDQAKSLRIGWDRATHCLSYLKQFFISFWWVRGVLIGKYVWYSCDLPMCTSRNVHENHRMALWCTTDLLVMAHEKCDHVMSQVRTWGPRVCMGICRGMQGLGYTLDFGDFLWFLLSIQFLLNLVHVRWLGTKNHVVDSSSEKLWSIFWWF